MHDPTSQIRRSPDAAAGSVATDAGNGLIPRRNQLVLQRTALATYLQLCTGVADVEDARLAKQHAQMRATRANGYHGLVSRLEQAYRETRDTSVRQHDTLIRSVRDQYDAQIAAIESEYVKRRARVIDEVETTLRDGRKATDQEVWLADSVCEATREQIRRDREAFENGVPGLTQRLEDLKERAGWMLEQYGYQAPAADEPQATAAAGSTAAATSAVSMDDLHRACVGHLDALEQLRTPRFAAGSMPFTLGMLLCALLLGVAAVASALSGSFSVFLWAGSIAVVASVVATWLGRRALAKLAQVQMRAIAIPLQRRLAEARRAVELHVQRERDRFAQLDAGTVAKRDTETGAAQGRFQQGSGAVEQHRQTSLAKLEHTREWATTELKQQREAHLGRLESERREESTSAQTRYERQHARLTARRDRELDRMDRNYAEARHRLEERWREGTTRLSELMAEADRIGRIAPPWTANDWQDYRPANTFTPEIRFGQLGLDLDRIAGCVLDRTGFAPSVTSAFIPAVLELPEHCSLLLQAGQQGRDQQIAALQAIMARLLTSLPPSRVHFTIIDPVGLGESFAGFMHLADYDEALVGGRIWTEKSHIEQRLGDLTAHMENVIQKYLRNEFETIDAYNVQAGELAEPYRFLVIADFPANFTEEAVRRLSSIVASGPRCGVYTLIAQDTRLHMPAAIHMEDVEQASVHIRLDKGQFVWQDEVFRKFPLALDVPPEQDVLTSLMQKVGQAAGRARRVEVPFEFITPPPDQMWSAKASGEVRVPIGRTGAVRLQELRLGRGVAQHILIAGKTGSGKSTLLHVLITNLVLWYPPDEVEFYLIDFKKGVEFKTYATHELPHARAIAIESDREFGLSVLQRLDAEMERRGELFRATGVQDLPGYRAMTGRKLPRTLLVVDEFQIFFSEDDKIAQDAAILLDRLVRQGRAFGIHAILGSQTLGGTSGLARSTIGQMAVRIALQCSEADSQLIMDDGNSAARLLTRPGEAIYNDAGGLLQGNSPFQTAWLSDEIRDTYLDRVTELTRRQSRMDFEPPIVFEGNAPADLHRNRLLADLLHGGLSLALGDGARVWLGEAVAIKDPTAAVLRRQSGANVLLIGQRDDAALAIFSAAMVGLAAQHFADAAEFIILDGSSTATESPHALQRVAAALPQRTRFVDYRAVPEMLAELAAELHRRQNPAGPAISEHGVPATGQSTTDPSVAGSPGAVPAAPTSDLSLTPPADSKPADPAVYLFVHGLQRYRALRRSEDSFSFSYSPGDEDKPAAADRLFTEILREGPAVGIHVIAWADTPATVERTFDRQTLREFDNRVLFQMSAGDSSNLIDSPAANRLGFYRALFFSEEQGLLEKFRPYSLPDRQWLDEVHRLLAGRA